jgi:hypothetical protein
MSDGLKSNILGFKPSLTSEFMMGTFFKTNGFFFNFLNSGCENMNDLKI